MNAARFEVFKYIHAEATIVLVVFTGAWVLSGGTNHGVMKYVGDAVNILLSSHRVVALGIAPWGCIMNRKELTAPEVCSGSSSENE